MAYQPTKQGKAAWENLIQTQVSERGILPFAMDSKICVYSVTGSKSTRMMAANLGIFKSISEVFTKFCPDVNTPSILTPGSVRYGRWRSYNDLAFVWPKGSLIKSQKYMKENDLLTKLERVERTLSVFERNSNNLLQELEVNVPLDKLKLIVIPRDNDDELYLPLPATGPIPRWIRRQPGISFSSMRPSSILRWRQA